MPLAAPPEANRSWALVNLILAIVSLIAGCIQMLKGILIPKDDPEDDRKRRRKKIPGIAPAVLAIVAFILTEDISGHMTFVDKWTILMILFPACNGLLTYLTRVKEEITDKANVG